MSNPLPPLDETTAPEPKPSRIASTDDSERKRVAERLGELSDRLLVVSKAAKDIDAIRQDLHMFYAEEVAELVEAAAGALAEPPKPFVAPGEFNTAEHWPARQVAALVPSEPPKEQHESRSLNGDRPGKHPLPDAEVATTMDAGAGSNPADSHSLVPREPSKEQNQRARTGPAPTETPIFTEIPCEKANDSGGAHQGPAPTALVPRAPLEQLIGKWRGSVAYVVGSTTYVNGTFSACAKDLEAALRAAVPPPAPDVSNPCARTIVENADPHRAAVNAWFRAHGYVPTGLGMWGIAWSARSGYDCTDLEWYPLQRHADDQGWDAIIGCHASGENPRLIIGTCENLKDIQRTHEAIRLINGYEQPEDDRIVAPAPDPEAP